MKGVISRAAVSVAALIIICGIIGVCFALVTSSGEKKFQTGGVSIALNVFTETREGVEARAPDNRVLNSTENISYIPRITNRGETAYVRVKLTAGDMNISHLCRKSDAGWVLQDGYLYYSRPVEKDATVEVCRELELSEELEEMMLFKVQARADCIQAANFTPDFAAERPWGNVEIETSQIEDDYSIYTVAPSEREGIRVVFENGADKYVSNGDSFMAGFGELMPGDKYEDSLKFLGEDRGDVYFRVEGEKNSLTEKVEMTVTSGGKEYYTGPVYGQGLSEYRPILSAGEENSIVTFSISIPGELKDEYQRNLGEVTLFFKVEDKAESQPQTGDMSMLLPAIVMIALSGVLTSSLVRRKGGRL